MGPTRNESETSQAFVEIAPEETVLRALAQSAHPVEFLESNGPAQAPASSVEPTAAPEDR